MLISMLPALALINRRDLLQKNDAPFPQERRRRHRILPPACLPYNDPYRDNGVSQNDAVIYAVEILLPDGNFAILSGWLCDLSRNVFRLIGNAVLLHQQPVRIDAIRRVGFIGCSFSCFKAILF